MQAYKVRKTIKSPKNRIRLMGYATASLVVMGLLVVGLSQFFSKSQVVQAQAATAVAPIVHVQLGDAQDSSPDGLPGACGIQINGGSTNPPGTIAVDNQDPDCLRVRITNPGTYSKDFRFCLIHDYNTIVSESCSRWASESEGHATTVAPIPTDGGPYGDLSGMMSVHTDYNQGDVTRLETRDLPSYLPPGTTFGDVQVGVKVFYKNNNEPCQSGMPMQFTGLNSSEWSAWAYSYRDDDPGCFQAALRVGKINMPPKAQMQTHTIPTTITSSTTYNGNYNIVMKNLGSKWLSNRTVRALTNRCDESQFNYNIPIGGTESAVCEDYKVMSSDRFRLERTDNTPVQIRTQELRPNSNDVTFNGDAVSFSGPQSPPITNPNNDATLTTVANTIPYYVKQNYYKQKIRYSIDVCVEWGPGPNVDASHGENHQNLWHKFSSLFVKPVSASSQDPSPRNCTRWETQTREEFISGFDVENPDVSINDTAIFAPINMTTPSGSAPQTLEFTMVDLVNKTVTNTELNHGRFPIPAQILLNGLGFNCSVVANPPTNTAQYTLWATGANAPITVTMASSPSGPVMNPTPITLSTTNSYTAIANVSKVGLAAGTYTLTFNGSPGALSCASTLTVPPTITEPTLIFKFNNSETTPQFHPVNSNKTISWNATNATYCNAIPTPGTSWGNPPTTPPANLPTYSAGPPPTVVGSQSSGVLSNVQAYHFEIVCGNTSGQTITKSIDVNTDAIPAVAPTINLHCQNNTGGPPIDAKSGGSNSGGNNNGSNGADGGVVDSPGVETCDIAWGSFSMLSWETQNNPGACTMNPPFNPEEPDEDIGPSSTGTSSPNIYAPQVTYTATCTNSAGSGSDSVILRTPSNPYFTMSCTPLQPHIVPGQTQGYTINLQSVNGFNQPVQMSGTITGPPNSLINRPLLNIVSTAAPNATLYPSVSTNPSTSSGQYYIHIQAVSGGITRTCTPQLILDPSAVVAPSPPIVTVSNSNCGLINISLTPGQGGATVTGNSVYRYVGASLPNSNNPNWVQIATLLNPSITTFTDNGASNSNNYYKVIAYSGNVPSSSSNIVGPIGKLSCAADYIRSDKDVLKVSGKINKVFSPTSCNGNGNDTATLPNNALFSAGDKVTFTINVCNAGPGNLTNVSVVDDLQYNLEYVQNTLQQSDAPNCLRPNTPPVLSPSKINPTITFFLNDVPAPSVIGDDLVTVCSFDFTAILKAPSATTSAIYLFRNVADIHANEMPPLGYRVLTPPYRFSITGGVPDRTETAPSNF